MDGRVSGKAAVNRLCAIDEGAQQEVARHGLARIHAHRQGFRFGLCRLVFVVEAAEDDLRLTRLPARSMIGAGTAGSVSDDRYPRLW
jgi:hypothetical protein